MEDEARMGTNNAHSAMPVLNPRRVYKSNCTAKVKFLPVHQAKMLASGTRKRRIPQQNLSNQSSISLKKVRSSNSLISSDQSEPQNLMKEKGAKDNCRHPNAAVHVNAPSCSAFSLEGSTSDSRKLSPSLKDRTLEVGVASKSDELSTSELVKKKGYETYFAPRKRFMEENGPADAECHGNDSSSASTVSYRPKTGITHQAGCLKPYKVQHGGLSSLSPAYERYPLYGPTSERIWKGNFEVPDLPQELRLCEGLTAHCAAKISTKAYLFLKHIEGNLHFSSHPRLGFWPDIFKVDGPNLQDIVVYFYPGKFERPRKDYASLLKFIEKEDLMLRCVINHVELLVYPSKVLPVDSQKLGGSYFLWGVVRPSSLCI